MLEESLGHWNMVFLGSQVHWCQPILGHCLRITLTVQQKGRNLGVALLCNHVNWRKSILKDQDAISAKFQKKKYNRRKLDIFRALVLKNITVIQLNNENLSDIFLVSKYLRQLCAMCIALYRGLKDVQYNPEINK